MSKLIGTNPNQVPSNADLGTAAFMDKKDFLLSKGSSLSAIDAIIPKTAVDVFIYDTSKDSDGGAWRKRTQHTSWYNERLNTTTRGSRREFPAVAVIIVTGTQMIIHDADVSNLPMWMVFTRATGHFFDATQPQSISAKNGILYPAGPGGSILINFISEYNAFRNTTRQYNKGNIAERNFGKGWVSISGASDVLLNNTINDVAMTVLPNAPIDSATGLPVPTIAVATSGGVSIIKDDGSVVDITYNGYTGSNEVKFLPSGGLIYSTDNGNVNQRWIHVDHTIPSSDLNKNQVGYKGEFDDEMYHLVETSTYAGEDIKLRIDNSTAGFIVDNSGDVVIGSSSTSGAGLGFISRNPTNPSKGLTAEITSDHNTGWMHGDIKLATLSDTDGTDITFDDKQLIDQPYFNASTGWYFNGSGASGAGSTSGSGWSISGGKITQSGAGGDFYAVIPVVNNKQYVMQLTFDTTGTSSFNNVSWGFRSLANSGYLHTMSTHASLVGNTANQTKHVFWTANTTGNIIARVYSGEALSIDNFTVHLAEEDRSVKGKGLQVFGTVNKTPVAAGADLVEYSGFNDSKYLEQPYNSDIQFGSTNDFSITFWMKESSPNSSGFGGIIDNGYFSSSQNYFLVGTDSTGKVFFRISESAGLENNLTGLTTVADGKWRHIVCVRDSGGTKTRIYVNGVLDNTLTGSPRDVSNQDNHQLIIGNRSNSTNRYFTGSLSLLRISATAPSREQIKKMYEDEKFLFQENAKATLYGTSDAVTALGYDDSTDLLHVGTNRGRSVFQGLRRVDNTTDAVGTAISAVNGMVIEE